MRVLSVAERSVEGFRVADGEPLMGRVLVEADAQPAAPAVAVIGYEVWRTRFGSDPHALGRAVQLGNEYATVVGVMREGFEFPGRAVGFCFPGTPDLFDQVHIWCTYAAAIR